jgi:hypothetical protein
VEEAEKEYRAVWSARLEPTSDATASGSQVAPQPGDGGSLGLRKGSSPSLADNGQLRSRSRSSSAVESRERPESRGREKRDPETFHMSGGMYPPEIVRHQQAGFAPPMGAYYMPTSAPSRVSATSAPTGDPRATAKREMRLSSSQADSVRESSAGDLRRSVIELSARDLRRDLWRRVTDRPAVKGQ